MKVFVIIPCYNENNQIRNTIQQIVTRDYSIVIIDDGSIDNLLPEIEDFPVHFLRHEINLGQGAALQTGMDYALKKGADILVHFDADGQHNPEEIMSLVQPIIDNKADVVLGSRFLRKEDQLLIPPGKRNLLRFAILVNKIFSGIKLSDAHNGFRALSRQSALKINLHENRMSHATEILQLIKKHKLRFIEVPTRIVYTKYSRNKGQSSFNSINILFDLISKSFIK
jgi:glycosyltransferase involved in cell wall biosynthesis